MNAGENLPDLFFETQYNKYHFICGVDEAGRGPLAGPVCAAAVILPKNAEIPGLDDSKKLSEKKREALFEQIKKLAVAFAVAYASVEEIEENNIQNATFMAMNRAIDLLPVPADFALIDGNRAPNGIKVPCITIVSGDAKSMSVAAASILAKVSRDRLMLEYDRKYPQYMFTKHKGYGTKLHIDLINEYGPCEIHRPSFLKNIMAKKGEHGDEYNFQGT